MKTNLALTAAVLFALTSAAASQVNPGQSISVVSGSGGGIFIGDHTAMTSTQIVPTPSIVGANAVIMTSSTLGYVSTVGNPADVYEIKHTGGNNWATKKLNTSVTAGGNASQLAIVGTDLYFVTQKGAAGGQISSVPLAGGAVTDHLDISTIVTTPQLANGLCAIGTVVYVGTFNSGSTATLTGEIIAYDTVAKKGSLVLALPQGLRQANATTFQNVGVVNMQAMGSNIAVAGVYGDLLIVDPTAKKVLYHSCTCPRTTATATGNNLINSFDWDPVTEDWVIGNRSDAHIERWVQANDLSDPTASAERLFQLTPVAGSIGGIDFVPFDATGTDKSTGHGCAGGGGFTLTAANVGSPVAGNPDFAFRCASGKGGDIAVLMIGVSVPGKPLASAGITPPFAGMPACFLRCVPVVSLGTVLSAGANGTGQASVKTGIPKDAGGKKISSQWIEFQVTKTNGPGIVVSNGRETIVK